MPEVPVAESTVRQYVRARKAALGLLGQETFVPQSYTWGGEAQVDWYEGWAEFDGESHKTYLFCMRSMASGGAFHRAYRTPTNKRFWKPTNWRSPILAACLACCVTTT